MSSSDLHARWVRKRRNRVTTLLGGDRTPVRRYGLVYWSPRSLAWWIATLFMIGSACFVAGPVLSVIKEATAAGIVFFVGSLFFTSAAYAQFLEAINGGERRGPVRLFAWDSAHIEWQSTAIQLAGTLFFNISTFEAMQDALDTRATDRLVWTPDVFGSICFLAASWLAFSEVRRAKAGGAERDVDWWITVVNLAGSVAFGIAAIGSYVLHDTGELLNAVANNAGTFIGAICFFVGAYMLWPEAARAAGVPDEPSDLLSPLASAEQVDGQRERHGEAG